MARCPRTIWLMRMGVTPIARASADWHLDIVRILALPPETDPVLGVNAHAAPGDTMSSRRSTRPVVM